VAAQEAGDLLHRFDLGSHHEHTPVLERFAHDVDLLAIEQLAPLLLLVMAGQQLV